jgi:hypothetical protein
MPCSVASGDSFKNIPLGIIYVFNTCTIDDTCQMPDYITSSLKLLMINCITPHPNLQEKYPLIDSLESLIGKVKTGKCFFGLDWRT